MFLHENWHFSNTEERARKLRPEMDALSYVFLCGHASASCKDVTNVASFFCFKVFECNMNHKVVELIKYLVLFCGLFFALNCKNEKEKLLAEGWNEEQLQNGQLPSRYSFPAVYDWNMDNYLEVTVGSGTDVVIKVVNVNTERCVRYVFINSGSTYSIRNLPEGNYFLKIAYGKDWIAKNEKGEWVGRFYQNPLYEKGTDILNYRITETAESYQVPSYQLKLDVISTSAMNSFNSQNISETEFNE